VGQQAEIPLARSIIAIVDDDPAVLSALTFSLQVEGFAVRAYASGAALLVDLPCDSPGCLVIDYKLPGMNGLELLMELRHRQVASPAILMTTNPSVDLRDRVAAIGAALIEKPLLGEALFHQIRAVLATQEKPSAAPQHC